MTDHKSKLAVTSSEERLREENKRLYQHYQSWKARARSDRAEVKKIIQQRDKELDEQDRMMKDLEDELRRARVAADVYRQAAESAQREQANASELLARRTAELHLAQTFLPSIEAVADTCVVDLVQQLNYEILQTASSLAESYDHPTRKEPTPELLQRLPSVIHDMRLNSIVDAITHQLPNDMTTSLQIAIQTCLACLSEIYINIWRYTASTGLTEISSKLLAAEPEHIAVRWSALTRKYARTMDGSYTNRQLAEALATLIFCALVSGGYSIEQDFQAGVSGVYAVAGGHLEEIAELILELNEVIGQKVPSGWLKVDCVRPGATFTPDMMEVAYKRQAIAVDERMLKVLCTTAIGLQRWTNNKRVPLVKTAVILEDVL